MVLKRPEEKTYVELPARKAVHAGTTDVLVVGGSLAGISAAYGAAKTGAKVILAERMGFLGGESTASLCTILMSYYTQHPKEPSSGSMRLFPEDYGDGKQVIGGVYTLMIDRLVAAGGAIQPSAETGFTLTIDPEVFKMVALDLLEETGVRLMFYSTASSVVSSDGHTVDGVVFESASGPLVINAKMVVDCTGDGDVAAAAGAPYELGRKQDGYTQPITLYFLMGGFNREGFAKYVREHPDDWCDCFGLWELVKEAQKAGELSLHRENILMFGSTRFDRVVVDSTRVSKVNGTDVWDLTSAEVDNFRQMHELARFFKKYVPGFERSYIEQSGPSLYVRESRRIMGEYVLTSEDILAGRKFNDVVACGAYCIDIHNPAGSGTWVQHLPPGMYYDIPLRCLIPRNLENMLVADRCISGTHKAQGSFRIMPIGSATGHAAGVCAALCVRQGTVPRRIDVREVQKALISQNAVLGTEVYARA